MTDFKPMPYELNYNDDAKCPYCGHENDIDSDYYDSTEYDCDRCEETFKMEIEFTPSFTTSKMEGENDDQI